MAQTPVAVGLWLCDHVIIEEKTRNVTPVNCFTRRTVNRFPWEAISLTPFSVLTNCVGDIRLELLINRLDNLGEIYRRSLSGRFPDRLQEVRCIFYIRDCVFPFAGYYEVILMANNELVARRRFRLILKESPT